jgi:AbrB family looped-hinge helix DNA binding protein
LITLPSQVADDLKLKAGDEMLVDVKDLTIVVRKKNK